MTEQNNEYDLSTEKFDGYLSASLRTVAVTPRLARYFLSDVRRALLQAGTGRLLFQYDIAFALTDAEVLAVKEEWANILPGFRVAFLNTDTKHFDALKMAARMGTESGEEHRAFTDREAAKIWLLDADQ